MVELKMLVLFESTVRREEFNSKIQLSQKFNSDFNLNQLCIAVSTKNIFDSDIFSHFFKSFVSSKFFFCVYLENKK